MALRYAVLGLLSRQEMSGYDLAQRFSQQVSHFWDAHHTQIYRELQKLEEEGLVRFQLVEQTDRPDKKSYAITERGMEELLAWLSAKPKPPKKMKNEMLLRVSLFHLIPPELAISYIKESRAVFAEALPQMEEWKRLYYGENPPDELLGEFLTLDFGLRFVRTWIDWCEYAVDLFERRQE